MSTIQDILYAKALADAEQRQANNIGMTAGALTGTALGALAAPVQQLRPLQQAASSGQAGATRNLFAARGRNLGGRMAGGLVGAIVGGGLGAGVQQMAMSESPAANILARIQAQGGVTPADERELEMVLREIYTQGGM